MLRSLMPFIQKFSFSNRLNLNSNLTSSLFRCFATIGQGDGEQLLSLGKGCGTPGFALHELAHVIG